MFSTYKVVIFSRYKLKESQNLRNGKINIVGNNEYYNIKTIQLGQLYLYMYKVDNKTVISSITCNCFILFVLN